MARDTLAGGASRGAGRFFAFLLLLSGFCGISYEILYARMLGNLVGDQFAVVASILLTFLLGIGFGTLYAHRLWRWLWLIEAGIGAFGLFFALGSGLLNTWLYAALPVLGRGLGVSMLVCFLLLCGPAFLVGCSLPLFAGYLSRITPGRVFARAYMIYNFGAALTALLIEFALMRLFGLRLAVVAIASLNFFVAGSLLLGFGGLRRLRPAPREFARFRGRYLVALALASVASAVFQLLMVKIAECVLGPYHETFALVLALILFGIAGGAHLTERFGLTFGHAMVGALAGLLWLLAGLPAVLELTARLFFVAIWSYPLGVLYKLTMLALLMGLPALAFGSTVPALFTLQRNVARESGQLLFVSSVANAGGFLLMAFVLHRHLDYGVIVLAVLALSALALLVYLGPPGRRAVAVGAVVLAAVLVHRVAWNEGLLYLGYRAFHSPKQLALARDKVERFDRFKGYQDVFSINWTDGEPWLFINGYQSITLTNPSEKLVGAFSSIFAPRGDRALVLGLGSGATAGTVSLLFERTDAVEINPVLVENLHRMADYNFDIQHVPGTRIVIDDAIHFVKVSRETYSLIINTVTTPLYFSSSKLYTRDFLEAVRERLTPDGIYVTWMDSRIGDRGADIITRTVTETFEDCWIGAVKDNYFLLMCSQQPIRVRQPRVVAEHETLHAYFSEQMLAPAWLPYGLLSTRLHDLAGGSGVPLNTLDYPALEFEMARAAYRGIAGFKSRLMQRMSLDELERALRPAGVWEPLDLALYTEILLGRERDLYKHWRDRVAERVPDFGMRRIAARLEYLSGLAQRFDTAGIRQQYGYSLLEDQRYPRALMQLERALELKPTLPETQFFIGYCYEKLDQPELALQSYAGELRVNPRHAEAAYRRGIVFMKLGRYADALAAYDTALGINDWAEIHFARGQALELLREPERAMQAYRAALRRNAGETRARSALERLESTTH